MHQMHTLGGFLPTMTMDDAGIASGQAFLVGQLEKYKPELNEPLSSVTWPRDIFAETGGGFTEYVSNYFVDYASAGTNQYGIITGNTNVIAMIQANISRDLTPVFPWANGVKVPFLDQQKMQQIGRSLTELMDNGLRLSYNKALDQNVYFGFPDLGTYGLVNNPNVTTALAEANGDGDRDWPSKTPDEIVNDIDSVLLATWEAAEFDLEGMANHILLPPDRFGYIATTKVSDAGNVSILDYVLQNNVAVKQGRQIVIAPCRQVIDQGTPLTTDGPATQRMVGYVNNKRFTQIDITVPLFRMMTAPDPNQIAYISPYLAMFSAVQFKYLQTIYYVDGI